MITRHIADLLYHHDCVIVPGLGGFIKANNPAQILHNTHEFFPPSGSVAFNAGLAGNDGQLANYIASSQNTSYREALYEIKIWVDSCYETLKSGNKVTLDGIGELFLNASDKIEFTPSKQINFNADSFGLTIFFAKATSAEQLVIPEVQPEIRTHKNLKLRRLIPETIKWAAVLAPFIAFALWGSFKGNLIDNYVHNYSGMYSWVRSTPGKSANVAQIPVKATETPTPVFQSPAEILAEKNITFNPGVASYSELAKQHLTITKNQQLAVTVATESVPEIPVNQNLDTDKSFHIIGGAFRDRNNALKLIYMLEGKGFTAAIVDTTPSGLFVVSMVGFNSLSDAQAKLREIKQAGFPASWILKKHKV